jgi:hypothetical protein
MEGTLFERGTIAREKMGVFKFGIYWRLDRLGKKYESEI